MLIRSDGLASLSDVGKAIGLAVPDSLDANTLSGLLMEELARLPVEGDELVQSGFRITVCTVVDNRVGSVSIERIDSEPNDTPDPTSKNS